LATELLTPYGALDLTTRLTALATEEAS